MNNTVKQYIKKFKAWNEKRIFDKLTPKQKTAYIKKLLQQNEK